MLNHNRSHSRTRARSAGSWIGAWLARRERRGPQPRPCGDGSCGCHGAVGTRHAPAGARRVALVGSPNVGKSALFNLLTGVYATVSNYPGTTVEIMRGEGIVGSEAVELIDTPGLYSFLPVTEEERVTWRLLQEERPDLVLHVVEAAALDRMLPLTLQLLEAGFPVILVLNMMDECERLGLSVKVDALSSRLGIPVVATVAASGRGVQELEQEVARCGRLLLEHAV
ncbi:MAG TPA: FeoB small GTPase domain-containing protein [Limnochorda sp.]